MEDAVFGVEIFLRIYQSLFSADAFFSEINLCKPRLAAMDELVASLVVRLARCQGEGEGERKSLRGT